MVIAGKEIKRIVASGCSFTYGYGLEDRATQTWVAHLSNMLNVEHVNLGASGHGNEHVQNSITDYFVKNPDHKKDSFVIPCFSAYSRIEFPFEKCPNVSDTFTTLMNNKNHIKSKFIEIFFKEIFSSNYYYMKYLRIIITMQELLNHWKVPYLMFEALATNPHDKFKNQIEFESFIGTIDQSKWLGFRTHNLDNMTDPMEKLADGHPNANAYRQIAEILYKHIINTYETE